MNFQLLDTTAITDFLASLPSAILAGLAEAAHPTTPVGALALTAILVLAVGVVSGLAARWFRSDDDPFAEVR